MAAGGPGDRLSKLGGQVGAARRRPPQTHFSTSVVGPFEPCCCSSSSQPFSVGPAAAAERAAGPSTALLQLPSSSCFDYPLRQRRDRFITPRAPHWTKRSEQVLLFIQVYHTRVPLCLKKVQLWSLAKLQEVIGGISKKLEIHAIFGVDASDLFFG